MLTSRCRVYKNTIKHMKINGFSIFRGRSWDQKPIENRSKDGVVNGTRFNALKTAPRRPKTAPRRGKTRPRQPKMVPKARQDAPKTRQDAPKTRSDASTTLPNAPRRAQDAPKTPQRRAKTRPKRAWKQQVARRCSQDACMSDSGRFVDGCC